MIALTPIATPYDERFIDETSWAGCDIWLDLINELGHPFAPGAGVLEGERVAA